MDDSQHKEIQVSPWNWEELSSQGFVWKENIGLMPGPSTGEYIRYLKERYGADNVLTGFAGDADGKPVQEVIDGGAGIGVYVREKSEK